MNRLVCSSAVTPGILLDPGDQVARRWDARNLSVRIAAAADLHGVEGSKGSVSKIGRRLRVPIALKSNSRIALMTWASL